MPFLVEMNFSSMADRADIAELVSVGAALFTDDKISLDINPVTTLSRLAMAIPLGVSDR